MFQGRSESRPRLSLAATAVGRQSFLTFGDWTVRPAERIIERQRDRHVLEPRLMDVLVHLARHAGQVTSAEELLASCWPDEAYGDNPVHKCIAMLRKALGDDARRPRYIATVRKGGYRVLAAVASGDGEPHDAARANRWQGGSPYPGPRPFTVADAPVFFGRRSDRASLLGALRRENERRFALAILSGLPGCGVTSFMHAGIAATLLGAAGHGGMHAVAHASVVMQGPRDDALVTLASALCTWHIAGEPLFAATEKEVIVQSLRGDAALVLARVHGRLRNEGTVLLLLVDDMETLLPSDALRQAHAFLRALALMAASGRVVILGSCKPEHSPWLARLARHPDHGGPCIEHTMAYPGAGEIANMVRGPATVARLAFEEDAVTERRLDDQIIADATRAAWSLATLQAVLAEVYLAREAEHFLTFRAYKGAKRFLPR